MVLQLRINAPDWGKGGAKCFDTVKTREDDDIFFEEEEIAYYVCNGTHDNIVCPMRHECLIFALVNNEQYGVWGGMHPEDRTQLRRYTPKEEWGWRPPQPDAPASSDVPAVA